MRRSTTVRISSTNTLVLIDEFEDVTMAQLKLELLKEEAKEPSEGPLSQKVSAGAFLRKAIEIEDRW